MPVEYEWCLEELDEHGDCCGLNFCRTRREAEQIAATHERSQIALVRDVIRDGDVQDRTWAYIRDGVLSPHFGRPTGRGGFTEEMPVPRRFHQN